MALITLEELARACCVAIGGGIAGQLVVAMPGSALWLIPAGAAVAGCALTVPEIRSEVANTLPMLAAAGQRARQRLPGGPRRALPASQDEIAPPTSAAAAAHPNSTAAIPTSPKQEELVATLESTPHRLIIGHTRGGKTTLMHHMATSWAQQGERVLVADPDAAPGLWPGCTVTGHGDDLESITRMLEEIKVEVAARRKARAQGTRQFPPLHLVIDEAQDVLPTIEGGLELFEDIARRGGKLNIRMTVGVQDKQVKTLGLQGKSEVLRNLQVADVLRNRDGQRMAIVRDAETGQKISLAVPDLPNPERLIKPVAPQATHAEIASASQQSEQPIQSAQSEHDALLTALLATSIHPYQDAQEPHIPPIPGNRRNELSGHSSVTIEEGDGGNVTVNITQVAAQPNQSKAERTAYTAALEAMYETMGEDGITFAKAYAQHKGTKEIVFSAWQRGRNRRGKDNAHRKPRRTTPKH